MDSRDWIFQQYVKELASKKRKPLTSKRKTMLRVSVKKLHNDAIIPQYAKPGDAGLDLTATSVVENTTFQVTYGTGLAFEIPTDHVGLLFPRSSVRNYELALSNCVGVIDSGYRGEIRFTFNKTNGLDSLKYKIGDRIGQMVIIPYPQVRLIEETYLSDSERGENGFGSSGK